MTFWHQLTSAVSALAISAGLAGAAAAAEPITFQMSWKAQGEFGGYYQALAKGFYKACGVDMTIRDGAPGIDAAQLLSAGAVDVALLSQNDQVMRMNQAGFPARAVFAGAQKFLTILLYHDDAGISKPEDLVGKPVMISQGNRKTFWPFLQKKYGYSDDQLRTYNGQIAMWMADKTAVQQGVVTQEPVKIEKETGKFPSYFLLADMGYNPYTIMLVVPQKLIDQKPAVVQCLVDASQQGWADYMKDPSVAFAVIKERNPQLTDEILAYTYKMQKDEAIVENAVTAEAGIGAMTDQRWKDHFDLLVASELFPADFDYKSSYTTQFVKKPAN